MTSTLGKGPVLVIDDDPAIRDSLETLLKLRGYTVRTFESGQSFLDECAQEREGCLLVDIVMPGMNGLELQKRLADRGVDIPVCFITGHADVPKVIQAMRGGAVDFVEKPYSSNQIVESVERALAMSLERRDRARVAEEAAKAVDALTTRERQVLVELIAGRQNKVAAANIGISPRTVEKHRARIMEKLGARSLSQVIQIGIAAGVTEPPY
ncbi:MAG: DNA-binding response regulator [Rhodospirillaceae bacterium]|nr:DNA-binding response regulator [Rhodospirillaceae bacterium]|tara:strand:+ start:378 stop:1010 length:633 start_codon:yes stop_codon:yes gene_type:complete